MKYVEDQLESFYTEKVAPLIQTELVTLEEKFKPMVMAEIAEFEAKMMTLVEEKVRSEVERMSGQSKD
jgi:hypothetical protein